MDPLFSDIEPFLRVAETGSFRKAAERLGVSAPAVSKAVRRLEDRLGTRLFSRTTRRVALTPEGEAFLDRCRAAEQQIASGVDEITRARDTLGGELTVTAPFILGRFLAQRLPRFLDRHRDLTVRLVVTDRRIDLLGEHVDVAARIGDPGEAGLLVRRLARLDWVMIAAPAYLDRFGIPREIADLGGHRGLHFTSEAGHPVPWRLVGGQSSPHPPQNVRLLVDEGDLLVDAAIAGAGLAQVFRFMVTDALAEGTLVSVLDDLQGPAPELNAVIPGGRSLNLRTRKLLDFLYECFRQL